MRSATLRLAARVANRPLIASLVARRPLHLSAPRPYQSPERGSEEAANVDTDELANTDAAYTKSNDPGKNMSNVEKETGEPQRDGFSGATEKSSQPPKGNADAPRGTQSNQDSGSKGKPTRRSGGAD